MAILLSPVLNEQQFDANGDPLAGGFIYTYLAGTTTPVVTYKTSSGTAHSNPIFLDSAGYYPNGTQLWLDSGKSYKFEVQNSLGAIVRTIDNITPINDPGSSSVSEWVPYNSTAFTYVSGTSFTVAGDQRQIFQVARRLKTENTGGTIYSSIISSSYSAPNTTVTVVNDSGVLDAGLSSVSYGLLSVDNSSTPGNLPKGIQLQTLTRFTTGGTSTAYTLTPIPALASNTAGSRYRVIFNAAAGTTPTLSVSGLSALPLQYRDRSGSLQSIGITQVPLNWVADVECNGAAWVLLNIASQTQHSFNANRGATQAIPNNTFTKVQYNNETFDLGNNYDPVTNFRFTAAYSGIYNFTHNAAFSTGVDQTTYIVALYKNGTLARSAQHRFSGTGGEGVCLTADIDLLVNDYVEAYLFQLSGGSLNLSDSVSFFCGHLTTS